MFVVIVTNLGILNSIDTFFYAANGMDDFVTYCRNTCVSNPMSAHNNVRLTSVYCSRYPVTTGLVHLVSILFPGNNISINVIYCGDNYIIIFPLCY